MCIQDEDGVQQNQNDAGEREEQKGIKGEDGKTAGKGLMPDWEEVDMPPAHVLSHCELFLPRRKERNRRDRERLDKTREGLTGRIVRPPRVELTLVQ
jgi:hypothetical protein